MRNDLLKWRLQLAIDACHGLVVYNSVMTQIIRNCRIQKYKSFVSVQQSFAAHVD